MTTETKAAFIVIVDDDVIITGMIQAMIKTVMPDTVFHSFLSAENILSDIQNLGRTPTLIMMDHMMPGFDGWEAIELLKKDEQLKVIPVLAITASDNEENRNGAYDAGCDGYLAKPFTKSELVKAVQSLINKSKDEKSA